jgi:hypothetical protein
MRLCLYRLAALIALVFPHGIVSGSAQQARTEVGLLTCDLTQGEDAESGADAAPLRETRDLFCAFRPTNGGPEETYTGTLRSVGLEKELSEKRAMIWVVKGTRATMGLPGVLQQFYAADLAANPGHSPPLIGETNVSIVLHTLADEQAPAGAHNRRQIANGIIVLVALRLKSTPA